MKKQFKIIAAMALILLTAVAFAGCGSSEPKSLEQYIDENADARAEVEKAVNMESANDMDVNVSYEGNNATMTCQLKATYDQDMLDGIAKAYEEQSGDLDTSIQGAIGEIESVTGLTGVTMDVVIRNGDGAEIWKKHFDGK